MTRSCWGLFLLLGLGSSSFVSKVHCETKDTVSPELKIYVNTRYGVEFLYPQEWKITEFKSPDKLDLSVSPPSTGRPSFGIEFSSAPGRLKLEELVCPFNVREGDCKILKSQYGLDYVRTISATIDACVNNTLFGRGDFGAPTRREEGA